MCKSCLRRKPRATPECSPNFPSASYLDERTSDTWTNTFFKHFQRGSLNVNWFADASINVHNSDKKHGAIEFIDYTNLLATL